MYVDYDDLFPEEAGTGYEKNRRRAVRRHRDFTKAIRKMKIAAACGITWYSNLHAHSKNKIHCSCPMCRFDGLTASDTRKLTACHYSVAEERFAD